MLKREGKHLCDRPTPRSDRYPTLRPWLECGLLDAPLYFKEHPGPFLGEAAPLARAYTVTYRTDTLDSG